MNEEVNKKLDELLRSGYVFRNIIFDDWRGFRFIYDSDDVRICKNDCENCRLYQLLRNEPDGEFTAGLYLASNRDRELFGNQRYLNCKTLEAYAECFINFLTKVTETDEEILEELKLVRDLRLVYSEDQSIEAKEKEFKKYIASEAIKRSVREKQEKIKSALEKLGMLH